jgi:hypothetical protein
VAQLLILLLLSGVEGRFLGQGIFAGDCQHLFRCPWILHGELVDQGRVLDSLLEEDDNRFVIDLRNDVPFVAEALNKFSERLTLILYHVYQIPIDSWSHACGPEVTYKLSTQVGAGAE